MAKKSERLKAVRQAWENERKLVLEGKGTREWTPEQQRQIIEIGKALDDEGEAFEGHHMKSVKAFPDYAGDQENIQFLTRSEHKEAHKGSFNNPTNWYYNPETGDYKEFDQDSLEPCEIIILKESVVKLVDVQQSEERLSEKAETPVHSKNTRVPERTIHTINREPQTTIYSKMKVEHKNTTNRRNERKDDKDSWVIPLGRVYPEGKPKKQSVLKGILHGPKKAFNAFIGFTEEHPILTDVISRLINIGIEVGLERQYSSVLDRDGTDMDSIEDESSTDSTTVYEEGNDTNIDIDNKVGNGLGSPKAPHFRNGFTRKIKTGIDDDGNPTFREVPVRSTYVHGDQIEKDNNDD